MPLIECPDCGESISSSAPNCIKCGRPMTVLGGKAVQTQRKGGKYEGIGILVILLGMGALFFAPPLGLVLMAVGFVIFLAGRFM